MIWLTDKRHLAFYQSEILTILQHILHGKSLTSHSTREGFEPVQNLNQGGTDRPAALVESIEVSSFSSVIKLARSGHILES